MSLTVLADFDTVLSLGSRPGTKGYAIRDSGTTVYTEEGLMRVVSDEPGNPKWVLARGWNAVNGEQPEVASWDGEQDHDAAQARRKEGRRGQSRYLLSDCYWYRLREADGGTTMPANILTYRNDVRTEANDSETAIDALGTVDTCRDFVSSRPTAP